MFYIQGLMRMRKINKLWLLMLVLFLPGCYNLTGQEPTYHVLPYQENMIGLQNLQSRVIVYCYHSEHFTTEQCAENFENMGFVRLNDIPRLPAEYDSLQANSYPSRRWRKDEQIPRW